MMECVQKIKKITGRRKIFMAGQSFGGQAMENYASLHWKRNLKGIIGLDGGNAGKYVEGVTNTHNLTEALDAVPSGGWGREAPWHLVWKYAYQFPGAPNINPYTLLPPFPGSFDNVSEFGKFYLTTLTNLTNMTGGYGTLMPMLSILSGLTKFFPTRLTLFMFF